MPHPAGTNQFAISRESEVMVVFPELIGFLLRKTILYFWQSIYQSTTWKSSDRRSHLYGATCAGHRRTTNARLYARDGADRMRWHADLYPRHNLHRRSRTEGILVHVHGLHVFDGCIRSRLWLSTWRLFYNAARKCARHRSDAARYLSRPSKVDRRLVVGLHTARCIVINCTFVLLHSATDRISKLKG